MHPARSDQISTKTAVHVVTSDHSCDIYNASRLGNSSDTFCPFFSSWLPEKECNVQPFSLKIVRMAEGSRSSFRMTKFCSWSLCWQHAALLFCIAHVCGHAYDKRLIDRYHYKQWPNFNTNWQTCVSWTECPVNTFFQVHMIHHALLAHSNSLVLLSKLFCSV